MKKKMMMKLKIKKIRKIKLLFLSIITTLLFIIPVYADTVMPGELHQPEPIIIPVQPDPVPPVRNFDFEDLAEFILSVAPYGLFIASWLTVIGLIFRDSDSVKKKILSLICFQIALSIMIIMFNALMMAFHPIFLLLTIILLIVANVFMIKRIVKCKNSFGNKEVFMEKEGGSCK